MATKNEALIHLQYVREGMDRLERKFDAFEKEYDARISAAMGKAEGAHARLDAWENKGKGFGLATILGVGGGGGAIGAFLTKLFS
jgi:hypothetical protein